MSLVARVHFLKNSGSSFVNPLSARRCGSGQEREGVHRREGHPHEATSGMRAQDR